MPFPEGHVALAASASAELVAAAGLIDRPLPPLAPRPRPGAPLEVAYLMPRTGAGGGARVLLEHANHLVDLGARVTVLSHHPAPEWFGLRAPFVHVPFATGLERALPPCDVIVAGYWTHVLPARHLGIAPVVHFEQGDFHLYDEIGDDLRRLVAASVQAADWTITVGAAAEAALAERYGVRAHRIPNAVDRALFFPGEAPEARRVLFVGWDGARFKGIDVARQVAAGLAASHPDVAVTWVTPAPPAGAPLGEVVVGPAQEELARHYRSATVYVGTSRYESFPLPPLEAMASGVPVVSTANGGIEAYAVDGDNCLLAPVDDVDGLLAATRRVLDEPDVAARLRRGGLRAAAAHSWPVIVGDLLARYEGVAGRGTAGTPAPAEVDLDGVVFRRAEDAAAFAGLVARCPHRNVAIPVAQPAFAGYRVVRWRVVARRPDGAAGTAYLHRLADAATPVDDSPYQFGIDLLREGLAEEAFAWFSAAARQAPGAEQVLIGRWIVVSLIAAGRLREAQVLAEAFAAQFPAHADFYVLGVRAGAGQAGDPAEIARTLDALGPATLYDEWLDEPSRLLAAGVR